MYALHTHVWQCYKWFTQHLSFERELITWGEANQVEKGMVMLLWKSKILENENIGDLTTDS